jgi:hypothetical protein
MTNSIKRKLLLIPSIACFYCICVTSKVISQNRISRLDPLVQGFISPPDSAGPGVYWYFMDGNLSKKGMTEDLESMKKVGINHVVFLEVNVGIPRGPIDFLSDQWQELFKHAVNECTRLGIQMTLGIGPGWTGSGGPWIPAAQSMQHLVSSTVHISGDEKKKIILPVPAPRKPYFGEGVFTPELKKQWNEFYEDVAVLAFPTPPVADKQIGDIDEKALYYRAPYSSVPGVKQFLPALAIFPRLPAGAAIAKNKIIDLTNRLQSDSILNWQPPKGQWTIMRFGSRNNGAVTRPAPIPGLGFEADKFDTAALNAHLDHYIGKLFKKIGTPDPRAYGGLKTLHMDSWEMGAQNWTSQFRKEFLKRRGYDPLPFFPVYAGNIVESIEVSERFLWDLRLTSQELVLENHAGQVKKYSHKYGLNLSIEPYDMNPTADLELGAVADIPMCEFWSKNYGFNSSFSCVEATSIAHVNGIAEVRAEAFTAEKNEGWKQYPGSMKNQGDWAFATGINRFVYHTFQHQFLADTLLPGATMGPYGIHWDRGQTWWPMVESYHQYIKRCQFILQQGRTVADVLYLTPEGAPHVFRPPASAMTDDVFLPDRRGYNFDGCSPGQLYKAMVKDHKIVFPGGASYRLLILPFIETMTLTLLQKVRSLIADGAIVIGLPPVKSPGLSGFPTSDVKLKSVAKDLWGEWETSKVKTERKYGIGKIVWGGGFSIKKAAELYPSYETTSEFLKQMKVPEDFKTSASIRYTHRTTPELDIYFVSNRTDTVVATDCIFRSDKAAVELWDPVTGKIRKLSQFSIHNGVITLPMKFDSFQSFFIVFRKGVSVASAGIENFPVKTEIARIGGSWEVSFDPKWGGPESITFDSLTDWTTQPEEGIKYYSGTAVYKKTFDFSKATAQGKNEHFYLDLGEVKNLARVRLNGEDLGVVWTAPWCVDITGAVKESGNVLEIEIANLWPNRLIGDEKLSDDGIQGGKWPGWLSKGQKRTSGRHTFTTFRHYTKDSPLLKSGLIGPVTILKEAL